jgi:hypothetical protein
LSIRQDPKFAGIANDPLTMGHYTLLLLDAEAAFPHPASVPRWVDQQVFDDLVARGIVDQHEGDRYTVHGLLAEREARVESARKAGKARAATGRRDEHGRLI